MEIFFFLIPILFMPFFYQKGEFIEVKILVFRLKIFEEGILILTSVLLKSVFCVTLFTVLLNNKPFSEISIALKKLRMPSLIVNLLIFTYRYLFYFREIAISLNNAIKLKGFNPKHIFNTKIIGQIIGSLFIISYNKSEKIYYAMLSKGFSGSYRDIKTVYKIKDIVFSLFCVSYMITSFILGFIL